MGREEEGWGQGVGGWVRGARVAIVCVCVCVFVCVWLCVCVYVGLWMGVISHFGQVVKGGEVRLRHGEIDERRWEIEPHHVALPDAVVRLGHLPHQG